MPTSTPARRPRAAALTAAVLGALLLTAPVSAVAADDLDQVIDPDQQQGSGQVVLSAGHADFGPTSGTGQWALQIHDDTGTPRYWRDPEDVVFQVSDAALLTVPDDDAFAFLGMPAGSPAHVIPQTEQPGVVWVGWNTQEPTLRDELSLGTTLRIHAVEGPGDVVIYLQGGNFGAPEPLWSTHEPFPQDAWIEVNTHTHANWVFSAPGVYLVDAEFTGDLISGETFSARGVLRFAVGDATDPAAAFAATLAPGTADEEPAAGDSAEATDEESTATEETGNPLWYVVAGGAVLLAAAVTALSVATRRARRRGRAGGEDTP